MDHPQRLCPSVPISWSPSSEIVHVKDGKIGNTQIPLDIGHSLRYSWVFLEGTRILSRFQFTRHVIKFVLVETKRFVDNHPNRILTRQMCRQLSIKPPSKRRALAFHFSIWIWSKCRGDSDPGLCTTSVLVYTMPLRGGDLRLQNVFDSKICRNLLMCGCILFASTKVVHRPRSNPPLHFDIRNIWWIRTPRK